MNISKLDILNVYLATPNIDPKNPFNEGFALSDLTKVMGLCRSKRLVGVIDACYSGAVELPNKGLKKKAARVQAQMALANYDKVWKKTPKTKGVYLLLSSQSYETSNAEINSNSLKYLLERLKGVQPTDDGDQNPGSIDEYGYITPESLHRYVHYKVATITDQVPDIKVDAASTVILAIDLKKGKAEEKRTTSDEYESLRLFQLLEQGKIKEFNDIRKQNVNKSIDLHSVNLAGANLEEADLHESNLQEANLKGARLMAAKLSRADLKGANLERAYINRADLRGASLRGAILKMAIIEGTNLQGADLRRADLGGTSFASSNLVGADLRGARFYAIKVRILRGRIGIKQTFFAGADLRGANLKGTNLRKAFIERARLLESKNLPIPIKEAKSRGAIN